MPENVDIAVMLAKQDAMATQVAEIAETSRRTVELQRDTVTILTRMDDREQRREDRKDEDDCVRWGFIRSNWKIGAFMLVLVFAPQLIPLLLSGALDVLPVVVGE